MSKAFQIEVRSRSRPGRQVFAVEAQSEMRAELALERYKGTLPDPIFSLRRMLSDSDIAKMELQAGSIVQLI